MGVCKYIYSLLACSSLSQSFLGQSAGGGDSGMNTKSASDDKAVTSAKYLIKFCN